MGDGTVGDDQIVPDRYARQVRFGCGSPLTIGPAISHLVPNPLLSTQMLDGQIAVGPRGVAFFADDELSIYPFDMDTRFFPGLHLEDAQSLLVMAKHDGLRTPQYAHFVVSTALANAADVASASAMATIRYDLDTRWLRRKWRRVRDSMMSSFDEGEFLLGAETGTLVSYGSRLGFGTRWEVLVAYTDHRLLALQVKRGLLSEVKWANLVDLREPRWGPEMPADAAEVMFQAEGDEVCAVTVRNFFAARLFLEAESRLDPYRPFAE